MAELLAEMRRALETGACRLAEPVDSDTAWWSATVRGMELVRVGRQRRRRLAVRAARLGDHLRMRAAERRETLGARARGSSSSSSKERGSVEGSGGAATRVGGELSRTVGRRQSPTPALAVHLAAAEPSHGPQQCHDTELYRKHNEWPSWVQSRQTCSVPTPLIVAAARVALILNTIKNASKMYM